MQPLKGHSFSSPQFRPATLSQIRSTSARQACDLCSGTATRAPKRVGYGFHHEAPAAVQQQPAPAPQRVRTHPAPSTMRPLGDLPCAEIFIVCSGANMSDEANSPRQSLPVANYSSAIARALDWLGDRYLLARPMNASRPRSAGQRALSIRHRLSSSMPRDSARRIPAFHAGSHTAARVAHPPSAP